MEDLVPLLIFIVIAVINVLKYQAEKKGKGKQPPARPAEGRPQRQPTTLEEFFEEIAQKFEPRPTPLPDWPESIERRWRNTSAHRPRPLKRKKPRQRFQPLQHQSRHP